MAASIGRSRHKQMRCDVIGHVTALDQSEPSLIGDKMAASIGRSGDRQMRCEVMSVTFDRSAPGDCISAKQDGSLHREVT